MTVTPHGRSLCPVCWARREAKRREVHKQRGAAKPGAAKPGATKSVAAKAVAAESTEAADSTSFEALMGGDAPSYKTRTETPRPGREGAAPAKRPELERATEDSILSGVDAVSDAGSSKPRQFHREVPVRETLDIDQRRPILTESGYQAPSKLAYLAAFVFFGIAGIIFINSSPRVQDMMFPFELGGIEYDENARPVEQDTNALRNTSNINNFSLMRDLPLFILTWVIVLIYVLGAFLVFKEVVPTMYQRWKGWRNEQRMRGVGGP